MKDQKKKLEETLRRHLSLFGAPSVDQLDDSRRLIVERLTMRTGTPQEPLAMVADGCGSGRPFRGNSGCFPRGQQGADGERRDC
jgi:hypothetical protein